MTAQWFTCSHLSFQAGFSSSKNVHRRLWQWRFNEFLWKSTFKSSNPSRWARRNALFQICLINNQNLQMLFLLNKCSFAIILKATVLFSEIWNNINGKLKFLKYFRNMLIQNSSMCAIIIIKTQLKIFERRWIILFQLLDIDNYFTIPNFAISVDYCQNVCK